MVKERLHSRGDLELEDVGDCTVAERLSTDDLGVWGHSERGDCAGRESCAGKCDGKSSVRAGNSQSVHVVQSGSVCCSVCVHVRKCREKLCAGTGYGDGGCKCGTEFSFT